MASHDLGESLAGSDVAVNSSISREGRRWPTEEVEGGSLWQGASSRSAVVSAEAVNGGNRRRQSLARSDTAVNSNSSVSRDDVGG